MPNDRNLLLYFVFVLVLMLSGVPITASAAAVDTVKPSISGASNKTVYFGTSFNPLSGVTAKDNVDGNLTKKIKVSGSVNTKKTGSYKLTYSVSDKAKNKTTVTRTITVKKDTTKPTISGASNKTVYIGSSFNPLTGVTAKDNVDGNITKKIQVSGSANLKKTGTYKLSYSVSDKAKNKTTVTRTITVKKDTTKPTISGASNKSIYMGSSFNPLTGITAKDNVDGNITKNLKVSGSVNVNKAGTYKLMYSVVDKAKNKTTVTRTVTVKKDTTKPTISGASSKTINIGSSFNPMAGISAKDDVDGNLTNTIKVAGQVNTNKAGKYQLTYSVSDKAKNKATVTRTITVRDHIMPKIQGAKDTEINIGEDFNALNGVTATDNNDGDLTSAIKIEGAINVNKAGIYHLTYLVADKAGNKVSVKRKITVIDTVNPEIHGAQDLQINFEEEFNPLTTITATDNSDGDLTASIQVEGAVNVHKAGDYELLYSVADQSGNVGSQKRIITVIDHISPAISGATNQLIGLFTPFNLMDGVTASDNNDGDITFKIETSGSVDTSVEGTYSILYKVEDAAGNIMEINRTITVQKIAVADIFINAPDSMKSGKSQQLTAIVSPQNATNQQVTWQSSDDSVATVDQNGVVRTLTEGTVTITATADGISSSTSITVSDRPNLYLYKSGSVIINNVIKSFSISMYNLEPSESVFIEKVEIYENESLFTSYSAESLNNSGISTTVYPGSNWGMSVNFKLGIWANQSKVVVTVRTDNGKTYQYNLPM